MLAACATGQQSFTYPLRVEARLVLLTNGLCLGFSLLQIGFDFRGSPEVIGDHLIHIGKIQGQVLLDDFFCRCALREGCDNIVQCYTCLTDSNDAVGVGDKGYGFSDK